MSLSKDKLVVYSITFFSVILERRPLLNIFLFKVSPGFILINLLTSRTLNNKINIIINKKIIKLIISYRSNLNKNK